MISMGMLFVIFATVLLFGGTLCTVLWFRQAGARLREAGTKPSESSEGWRRL
jgi:hypothetical protein